MQGARMNYVNDSAPMHLCSAMNAPTTAVFCSTVPAFGFGPLADHSRIAEIRGVLECRPCNLHGRPACPLGHFRCAHDILINDIVGDVPGMNPPVGQRVTVTRKKAAGIDVVLLSAL